MRSIGSAGMCRRLIRRSCSGTENGRRAASCANRAVSAIVAAGLHIEHISEHAVDAELAQRMPRAEPYLNWPMLLMLKLRKVTG